MGISKLLRWHLYTENTNKREQLFHTLSFLITHDDSVTFFDFVFPYKDFGARSGYLDQG